MPVTTFSRVAVTRTGSPLGERVVVRLRDRGAVVDVVDADERGGGAGAPGGRELKGALEGVEAVVHLAGPRQLGAVLDAASGAGSVRHVVLASTSAVYGAWPDNGVPLPEDAPLRPNPGFAYAAEVAEAERLLAEWTDGHPGIRAAVLRLAPVLAPAGETWLSGTLARPSLLRPADSLPPVQVLHVEDAASAVVHAVTAGLDGAFNVAPDGWVPGETARALSAAGVPMPLPDRLAAVAERLAYRLRLGGVEPAAAPYRVHPWVVANDRLRATGWAPAYTAEEALVACRKGSWWRELSPARRQEVALGASGGLLAVLAGAVVVAARAGRRRR